MSFIINKKSIEAARKIPVVVGLFLLVLFNGPSSTIYFTINSILESMKR